MNNPTFEIFPLRPAVRTDAPVSLDVLLRITPPAPEHAPQRPRITLGLVLDRSGSMAGENKIGFTREAAAFAIGQLLPEDRVSVTVFDDRVETLIPSTLAQDRARLAAAVARIQPRGSTA